MQSGEHTPLVAAVVVPPQPILRLAPLDLLRGVLMILMAIDHAKGFLSNFVYPHEQWFEMPDYKGNVSHFLSRFVTGFCAPGFFMLMGWGVALFVDSRRRIGWTSSAILKHFALRGTVLLLFNEITILPVMLPFYRTVGYFYVTTVLFSLGINMFLASVFIPFEEYVIRNVSDWFHFGSSGSNKLTVALYVLTAVVLTMLPSLYTPTPDAVADTQFSFLYLMWFLPRMVMTEPTSIVSLYPPFAWLAPTLWGVGIGRATKLFKWDASRLGLINMVLALSMISLSVVLRYDVPWTSINPSLLDPPLQSSAISFFNNVKYPPSVVYILTSLGGNHLLLGLLFFANPRNVNTEAGLLMVFGGSSLFFYVTHFFVYQGLANVLLAAEAMPKEKFGWWAFWAWYAVGLVIEYYMCKAYARFKRSTSKDSLWRLF